MKLSAFDPVQWLVQTAIRHGGFWRLPIPFWHIYMVSRAELVQTVLIRDHDSYGKSGPIFNRIRQALGRGLFTAEGSDRLRMRRLLQPAFSRSSLTQTAALQSPLWQAELDDWQHHDVVDLAASFIRLNMRVLARQIAGDHLSEAEVTAMTASAAKVFRGMPLMAIPEWLPGGAGYRQAIAELDGWAYLIIERCRQDSPHNRTIMGRLLWPEDQGQPLTQRQLRDQIFTLLMAGFDSTAVAESWFSMQLAMQSELMQQLQTEIETAVGSQPVTLADLRHLPSLAQAWNETLRRGPFPLFFRSVERTVQLGGVTLRRGSQIILSPSASGQDPHYWPQPEVYDPDRFAEPGAAEAATRNGQYYPFGMGPRQCIAKDAASMQALLALAELLRRYSWRPASAKPLRTGRYAMTQAPRDSRVIVAAR